jgi:hypothetical protein
MVNRTFREGQPSGSENQTQNPTPLGGVQKKNLKIANQIRSNKRTPLVAALEQVSTSPGLGRGTNKQTNKQIIITTTTTLGAAPLTNGNARHLVGEKKAVN